MAYKLQLARNVGAFLKAVGSRFSSRKKPLRHVLRVCTGSEPAVAFGRQRAVLLLIAFGTTWAGTALAQTQVSRLAGDVRVSDVVIVPASKPVVNPAVTMTGAVAANSPLNRMLLLLSSSPAQQRALNIELQSQQNPASSEYHHWFTPPKFADKYGNSAADVAAVAGWLQSQGFQVAALPAGRGWIEFSGTAAQVEQAFHTQINSIVITGKSRAVLAGDISVPAALAPLVRGLVSLDGSLSTPALTVPQALNVSASELAAETSLSRTQALTPGLIAPLLQLDALHAENVLGAGETIAIAARSNIRSEDVDSFRAAFSLSANPVQVILNGADPGLTPDQGEATMAASWAGVAAPAAKVLLVPAATTTATDGVDLSLAAIVDQVLARTVAVGFSSCEAALSATHQAFYSALYQQAAAEGIAIVASTGDSGPAACHAAGSDVRVTTGYAVNALASTPWNAAVGVAAFGNAGPQAGVNGLAAWSPASETEPAYASGGGNSTLYAAPYFQPNIQDALQAKSSAARYRQLPDVALPTAIDADGNRGLAFCLGDSTSGAGCTLVRSGGSSAAAAIFAGIGALIAEKNGAQGNLAPGLYGLSRQSGVFNDVKQGSGQLWCAAGSPGCDAAEQIGFAASEGYDLTTGLGAVNAHALVTLWATPESSGTGLANVTNTTAPSQTINPSGSLSLSAVVASGTGGPAPTGTVSFYDQSTSTVIATATLVPGTGETSTASATVTGVLTQGGHPIQANYSGDSVYAAAHSQPVVVEVEPSATTLTVTPATFTPNPGSTLSVTAVITSNTAGQGASPPTGSVNFMLDGVSQGTKQVIPGSPSSATINITIPYSAGTHQIVGFYSGDSNYTNATSQAAAITVAKSLPTVAITPSTTTPLAGGTMTIAATISAPAVGATPPSGTILFTLDGTSLGTAIVAPGAPSTANITITVPSTGTHTLQGTYGGDSNYSNANSNSVTITVAKTPTTLVVTPATTTPSAGGSLQVTATLGVTYPSSTLPTGTVTFTLDGVTQGVQNVVSGTTATITMTGLTTGTHTLQASYSGDSNFSSSVAASVTLIVAKASTTLVLTPATTTPAPGSSLQVTATVSSSNPSSSPPSGTVTFTVDGVAVGTATVVPGTPSTAVFTIPSVSPGAHILLATYSGDSSYSSAVATAVSLNVTKSPTTTVLAPSTLTPTAGGTLQVTAAVTATTPGPTLPTGTVSFALDGTAVATGTVLAGSPSTANVTISIPSAGPHVLTATYSGDTYYGTSTSSPTTLTAAKGATVTTVTATPPALTAASAETLTATIAPFNAMTGTIYTITGTVSFYDGGSTLLGTATVTSDVATLSGITLADNVSHSITAIYSGDANWLASSSVALPLTATTLPDSVVLVSNLGTVPPGQSLILTATVTPAATPALGAEQNPTGNVIFYDGTTVIGTVALVASPTGDSSSATLTTASQPGGNDTFSAFYVGDLYYDAATSNLLNLAVEAFAITPSPSNPATNLNIIQGSAGSASFVITGLGGFNNLVQVVCAVPTQDDMTCTATPQQVTPTATVSFVVQTFTSGGPSSTTTIIARRDSAGPRVAGGAALALLAFFLLPFGRRARTFTRIAASRSARRFMVLLLLLVGLAGAGIGCTSTAGVNSSGTPLGVATLKITASAYVDNTVVSQSVYLTVNVLAPGSTLP